MSVDQTNIVDFVSVDTKTNTVRLTISDHLDWADEKEHLRLLQEKINQYLAFIKSGEVWESVEFEKDRPIYIDVIYKHEPSAVGLDFFSQANEVVELAGFGFTYKQISS